MVGILREITYHREKSLQSWRKVDCVLFDSSLGTRLKEEKMFDNIVTRL